MLIMVDSQAVKNTCNASITSKGFCHYKVTNGIKRHLGVDTLGLPFMTHCTEAIDYFHARPADIPKLTILMQQFSF